MVGALNRYVELRLSLVQAEANHQARVAELNSGFDYLVQASRDELASLETSLQLFAEGRKEELFKEPKSREYANATLGFRLSPPAVGKRVSKDTFEAIGLRLENLPWGEPYCTYKGPVVDKEALLRDRAQLTEEQLKEAGICFEQTENFFIEPKAAAAEPVRKETAA